MISDWLVDDVRVIFARHAGIAEFPILLICANFIGAILGTQLHECVRHP